MSITRASSLVGSTSRFDNTLLRSELKEFNYLTQKSHNLLASQSALKAENERLLLEN